MTVKMGAPMPPNPMMPRQPVNPLPPPMPVPPINPNMQFGQQPVGALPATAGTFPVNKDRRKRFGDSLETMLARPPMVASDQMANMNVFTGQMMNTAARPPVVGMRGGGIVRNMRRGGTSMADYSGPSFAAAQSAASKRNPGRTGAMTHDQLMDKIRGGSSPNDDKPPPVVTAPVVPMDFGDDNNYTPTSAELNEALKDTAAVGMPDLRQDQSDVYMPQYPDLLDRTRDTINDYSAYHAMVNKYGTQGTPEDRATILAPGTGGLSSVPSTTSVTYAPDPRINLQEASFTQPGTTPTNAQEMSFTQPSSTSQNLQEMSFTQPNTTPMNAQEMSFDYSIDPMSAQEASFDYLGLGDPNATKGAGGGQGGTGASSGGDDEDDEELTFLQRLARDFKAIPGNIAYDMKMLGYAGLFGSYKNRLKNMMDNGVPEDIAKAWLDKSQDTMDKMMEKQAQQSAQDDDGPMSTSPIDPCPPGSRLDPVAGICVPIEEGEDEGPSYDLNRTRDDEFSELDDIMNKIVKPVGETDNVRTMQAGGSVGLNRVADNFLAAMGA